jgi:mRNA interferase RelE/StbE
VKFEVKLIPRAVKDLNSFQPKLFARIFQVICALSQDPRPHGAKKLSGGEGYRIRVGTIRVLYRIDDKTKTVYVYRARHRKEVYR